MDHEENYFLLQNKLLEDKIEKCCHIIETRLDKLFQRNEEHRRDRAQEFNLPFANKSIAPSPFTSYSLLTFKSPYIRDFRGFSGPTNEDVKQIQQLTGSENIDFLIKNKHWTRETKAQLTESILDHYARSHLLKLLKQKNQLLESPSNQNNEDVCQKLRLIDEQTEQVKARKEPRIFVPEDRLDCQIDWCAISAKLPSHHEARDCRLMWSNNLHWSINNNLWTKEEDICLINAVAKHGCNDWEAVAQELNSNRLAWQCCSRYNQEYAFVVSPIDEEDVEKILEIINLCRIGNFVPWNQVMYFIHLYDLHQVKYQWQKFCSEKRAHAAWTHCEDILLMRGVAKYGEKDWNRIADLIPGRSNKSCRERYVMRLKYSKRSVGSWRRWEDAKLLSLVEKFGTNWPLIGTYLPERNGHQMRNRYELLKNQTTRAGPIKHRRILMNSDCELVRSRTRRPRSSTEIAVNKRLHEIFTTYCSVNKSSSKSLVCRSGQDEVIYQSLIEVLCNTFLERDRDCSLLELIISRAVTFKKGLLTPSMATITGYKAWKLQQEYLGQFCNKEDANESGENNDDDVEVDPKILKIIVSIFLWPAVLERIKKPELNVADHQVGSLIEKDSKNLYKIRDIQAQLTK